MLIKVNLLKLESTQKENNLFSLFLLRWEMEMKGAGFKMNKLAKQLTNKFAFLQGTYWISQCAINSFAAVYLRSKGFDNTEIGIVLSLASVLAIVLQLTISTFADKSKKLTLRQIIIALMFLVFGLSLILYIAPYSYLLIFISFMLISAIQFSLNPLFNPLALEYVNQGIPMNYGLARGIGSISFAITSYILGIYVTDYGPGILLPIFFVCYAFVIAAAFIFKLNVQGSTDIKEATRNQITGNKTISMESSTESVEVAPSGLLLFFKKYKVFTLFLVGVTMLFYSHNILFTYLINIMENVGGDSKDMGISLSIPAALELPTMAAFVFLVRKIKCSTLVKVSAFFFFVKVGIAWLAPNVIMIHFSQSLQLLAFALYTPASVYYANSMIEKQDKVKGQSMLGVSISLGAAIANITGGKLLDTVGVSSMLFIATLVTACGFLIVCVTTRNVEIGDL